MKIRLLALLFVGILSLSPTSYASESHKDGHKKFSVGSGIINSIDSNKKTINISHGPIPSLGWPEMTMDIATSDDINLSSLQKGQFIKFKIKLDKDNIYRIFKVKRSESKK